MAIINKEYVEIPIFLLCISVTISGPVITNLIIYRTCYVTLHYNQSECALLGTDDADSSTQHLEKLVQPSANVISMTSSFIGSFCNIFICIFVGPWSDKFGRKPILLSSIFGGTLSALIIVGFAAIPDLSPWYFLLTSVSNLFGGFVPFMSICLSYVTDISSEENRGLRMGVVEATMSLGFLLGTSLSSYIFKAVNYVPLFSINAALLFSALLYTIFLISESRPAVETEGRLKYFFKPTNVKDMFASVFKKREAYKRSILFCCILILTAYVLSLYNSNYVTMLLREKFGWSLQHYTLFSSCKGVLWVCGTVFSVLVLHKRLHIPESILILTGCLSTVNESLIDGFATKDWHFYFGGVVSFLGGAIMPMVRSVISKVISSDEIGRVFASISVVETSTLMVSSVLYTSFYNATIDSNPAAFNFLSASIFMGAVIVTLTMILLENRSENQTLYQILDDTTVNSEQPEIQT